MKITILGTGCPKCKTLERNVREAVTEMNLDAEVTKEEDIINIMNYGIMRTPGLVIDEKVVSSGHLLSVKQVKDLLGA
ncbi:MAG: TM0996/MTH895 family glutaredoxin-like protein [Bacteroidales bacterium]|nr:TM0996/MTH895 family glutaredoxin-like protein [Bacteroidales bacterium]